MKQPTRDFQIRITDEEGALLELRNYPTQARAEKVYPKVVKKAREEHKNEEDPLHIELVEVLIMESVEPFRHQGCDCALCGKRIRAEDDGESSENGSVHRWCEDAHF